MIALFMCNSATFTMHQAVPLPIIGDLQVSDAAPTCLWKTPLRLRIVGFGDMLDESIGIIIRLPSLHPCLTILDVKIHKSAFQLLLTSVSGMQLTKLKVVLQDCWLYFVEHRPCCANLPASLRKLSLFYDGSEGRISLSNLPKGLECLRTNLIPHDHYDLPPTLKRLSLGDTESSINYFPPALTCLKIALSWSPSAYIAPLPEGLEYLRLGSYTDVTYPSNLRSVRFTRICDKTAFKTLPASIRSLRIHASPPSEEDWLAIYGLPITSFRCDFFSRNSASFPLGLRELYLDNVTVVLTPWNMPASTLPNLVSLTIVVISSRRDNTFDRCFEFPPNLKSLTLSGALHSDLLPKLPNSLERFSFSVNIDATPSGLLIVRLPSSLLDLEIQSVHPVTLRIPKDSRLARIRFLDNLLSKTYNDFRPVTSFLHLPSSIRHVSIDHAVPLSYAISIPDGLVVTRRTFCSDCVTSTPALLDSDVLHKAYFEDPYTLDFHRCTSCNSFIGCLDRRVSLMWFHPKCL